MVQETGDPGLETFVDEVTKEWVTVVTSILPALQEPIAPKIFVWAFLAVISRSFGSHDGPVLAPVMDLFNHHANNHASVLIDLLDDGVKTVVDRQQGVAIKAIRRIKAGEEIYNHYHSHCAREWVVSYGFVPEDGLLPLSSCV